MAKIQHIIAGEVAAMEAANRLFDEVFGEDAYKGPRASRAHLERLLLDPKFIALVAYEGEEMVGALAGYELVKFEADRSEIYIYDLAVASTHRRQGIATAMIEALRRLAAERDIYVIYVQADYGDDPAIALYTGLGMREDVMHFDIPVPRTPGA